MVGRDLLLRYVPDLPLNSPRSLEYASIGYIGLSYSRNMHCRFVDDFDLLLLFLQGTWFYSPTFLYIASSRIREANLRSGTKTPFFFFPLKESVRCEIKT